MRATLMGLRRTGWGSKPTKKLDISRGSSSKKIIRSQLNQPAAAISGPIAKRDRCRVFRPSIPFKKSHSTVPTTTVGSLLMARYVPDNLHGGRYIIFFRKLLFCSLPTWSFSSCICLAIWFLCNFLSEFLFLVCARVCSICDSMRCVLNCVGICLRRLRVVDWIQFLLLMIVFLGWRDGELML